MTMGSVEVEHEEVVIRRGRRSGRTLVVAIHSSALGPAAGGVRLWSYPSVADAVDDARRLAEAMTEKCALAGLPHGGAKAVLPLAPGERLGPGERRALFEDLGDLVAELDGRYLAGEDVGTSAADLAVAAERTRYALCLPEAQGGIGEPSEPTAAGAHRALHAAVAHRLGRADVRGLRVGVQGFGQVGSRLARRLAADGAALLVADVDPTRRAPAEALGARWCAPEALVAEPLDVLVPAALGGVLTAASAEALAAPVVVGPANNQLAEPGVADRLHARGVLWVPDPLVGSGGVTYALLREVHGVDHAGATARVERVAATVTEVLDRAAAAGTTPRQVCARLVAERLAAGLAVAR